MLALRDDARSARFRARLDKARGGSLGVDEGAEGGDQGDDEDDPDNAYYGAAAYYPAKGEAKRAIGPAAVAFVAGVILTAIAWKASK